MKQYRHDLKRYIPIRLVKQCFDEASNKIDIVEFKQLCLNILNDNTTLRAPIPREYYCKVSSRMLIHCLFQCTIEREVKLCYNYMLRMQVKGKNGLQYAFMRHDRLIDLGPQSAWLAAQSLRSARVLWSARNHYGWLVHYRHLGKYYSELPLDWFDWDGYYLYKSPTYVSSLEQNNSVGKKPEKSIGYGVYNSDSGDDIE